MGKRKLVTLRTRKSTELECSDGKKEVPPGFQNLEPRWEKLPSTMRLTSVFSTYPVLCWDRETPIYYSPGFPTSPHKLRVTSPGNCSYTMVKPPSALTLSHHVRTISLESYQAPTVDSVIEK